MRISEFAHTVGSTTEAVAKAARAGTAGRIPSARIVDGAWEFTDACIDEWTKSRPQAELQNRGAMMPPGMRGGRPPGSGKTNGAQETTVFNGDGKLHDPLPGIPGATNQDKYLFVKIQQLATKAALDKTKLDYEAKKLVKREDVETKGAEFGTVLLQKLTSIPDRHGAVLASMTDEFELKQYLKKEINDLIVEIRGEFGLSESENGGAN